MMVDKTSLLNVLAEKPVAVERPSNEVLCKCGCTLAATIVYKRKYKRNRANASCPRCRNGFHYAELPQVQGKMGAYQLVMVVVKEAPLCK